VVVGRLAQHLAVDADRAILVAAVAHRSRERGVDAQVRGVGREGFAQRLLGLERLLLLLVHVGERDPAAGLLGLLLGHPLRDRETGIEVVRLDVDLIQQPRGLLVDRVALIVEQELLRVGGVLLDPVELREDAAHVRIVRSELARAARVFDCAVELSAAREDLGHHPVQEGRVLVLFDRALERGDRLLRSTLREVLVVDEHVVLGRSIGPDLPPGARGRGAERRTTRPEQREPEPCAECEAESRHDLPRYPCASR
jgi:hypothetical protein